MKNTFGYASSCGCVVLHIGCTAKAVTQEVLGVRATLKQLPLLWTAHLHGRIKSLVSAARSVRDIASDFTITACVCVGVECEFTTALAASVLLLPKFVFAAEIPVEVEGRTVGSAACSISHMAQDVVTAYVRR